MTIYAILLYASDGCTYVCNNILDSLWSTEDLALKRLCDLEHLKTERIEITIKEISIDTLDRTLIISG